MNNNYLGQLVKGVGVNLIRQGVQHYETNKNKKNGYCCNSETGECEGPKTLTERCVDTPAYRYEDETKDLRKIKALENKDDVTIDDLKKLKIKPTASTKAIKAVKKTVKSAYKFKKKHNIKILDENMRTVLRENAAREFGRRGGQKRSTRRKSNKKRRTVKRH
jgi:hypothetical protein